MNSPAPATRTAVRSPLPLVCYEANARFLSYERDEAAVAAARAALADVLR
jgi:hypothetical protein